MPSNSASDAFQLHPDVASYGQFPSVQKVVAGASHRRQDHATDRHPPRLRGASAPEIPRGDHRARAHGREPESADDHRAVRRRARGGGGALRHRVLRQRPQATVEGHPRAQRESPRRVLESHRVYHPAHGRDVCQLLHARGDGDSHPRVCERGRRDEENHAQSRQAMRRHRRRGAGVHPNRGDAGVFQKLLGPTHGARPQKLHAARGDDARDRPQGWRQRDRRTRRRGFKRRERAVQVRSIH